ncbi:MAG: O-acetyl-ADP-ribose deacetylase [Lentisphaeria bacterium]|nr:O-acetyl-ADP-ribose deacetylase [Lentisphaeria bacterium]
MNIEVITGDITTLPVDAIVNAANCGLLGGGGVDGAIHRAAGKALFEECLKVVAGLPGHQGETGQAYLTGAGNLPCKVVIHTPGPVYQDGRHGEAALLADCYANSLKRAEEKQCASIAFPCIATGVYGYPKEEAAGIALATVKAFPARAVKKVVFCCFSREDAELYQRLVAQQ